MRITQSIKIRQPLDVELEVRIDDAIKIMQVNSEEIAQINAFLDVFTPLLIADLKGTDKVGLRENVLVHIEKSSLSSEWKWSENFFIRKAVDGEVFDEKLTTEREARVSLLYSYFAGYVNIHQELLKKPLLNWAFWNYEKHFSINLKLDDDYINKLIEGVNSDELLVNFRSIKRFDEEYYKQLINNSYPSIVTKWATLVEGADYGELPEWLEYICCYLLENDKIKLLEKLFIQLSYPLIQSTLSYNVSSSDTAEKLLIDGRDDILCIEFLEMWHRNLCRQGSTLQLYNNPHKGVRDEILKEGVSLYKQWDAELSITVERVLNNFVSKFGWSTLFEWSFNNLHRLGSGLYSNEIRKKVDDVIEKQLRQAFQPQILYDVVSSNALLQFVCKYNLDKYGEDKDLWEKLKKEIEHLFCDIHERPMPKFEAESMYLWRGYAYAFAKTSDNIVSYVVKQMNDIRVYFEGYQYEDDTRTMLEKISKESFVLSSFMLISELDEISIEDRGRIITHVVDRVFHQIYAAPDSPSRAPYLVPLQLSVLVADQILKDQYYDILHRVTSELINFFEIMNVLKVANDLDTSTKSILKERWNQEKDVIELRSKQINKTNQFEELSKWVEGL